VAADGIDRAGPAFLLQGFAGRAQRSAIDHFGHAERLEVGGFSHLSGRADNRIAEGGQQRARYRADAAGGAGDQDFAALGIHAMFAQRKHRQGRGHPRHFGALLLREDPVRNLKVGLRRAQAGASVLPRCGPGS
jgi:hypothetical protein